MRGLGPLLLLALIGICVLSTAPLARPPIDDDGLPRIVLPAIPEGIAYTALGTFEIGDSGFFPSVTVPNITVANGAALVVCVAAHGGSDEFGSITWGGSNESSPSSGTIVNGTLQVGIYVLPNVTGGTHDVVIASVTDMESIGATLIQVSGPSAMVLDVVGQSNLGNSTTPSTVADVPTTAADAIIIGCVGTNGPPADNPGTWSNSFTNGQRTGWPDVGSQNVTVSEGYRIVSATGSYVAAKTGITSREWGACLVALKAQ